MGQDKPLSEASMLSGEANIPALASRAGREAHARALVQAGRVVMKSVDGALVERRVGGQVVVIKPLPASTPARVGAVLKRVSKPAVARSLAPNKTVNR